MSDAEARLPRRDFVLIPLLSLLTCITLFGLAEAIARVGWPEQLVDACVVSDPVLGTRPKPNCTSSLKAMEGPWVTNRYNECGYRTDQSCAARPEGTKRLALMGSSVAAGYLIDYDHSIGATMASTLTAQCGREVQVENMALVRHEGEIIAARIDEALALRPDAIVFLVTPLDFKTTEKPTGVTATDKPPSGRRLRDILAESRAAELAQHFMFIDSERFGSLYLAYGDRADYIRQPFTATWTKRLDYFDDLMGRLTAKADAAGVKLILAYVPARAQAIFLSAESRPPGVEPFAFGRALSEISTTHHAGYVDLSDTFAHIKDAGSLFYPFDGHITAVAQPIVGRVISKAVLAGAAPFQGCGQMSLQEDVRATELSAVAR